MVMTTKQIKLNAAFKPAKKSTDRYRIIYGGAGSGKSHYLGQEMLLNMIEDPNYSYLVVRKTAKSIKNSVFQSLIDIASDMGVAKYFKFNKTNMSISCANGSRLITSGLDDVEKLKSIAGINRVFVEEASEITEEDFNQLDLRLRGTSSIGYQLTLAFNPISETHWLKKRFFDIGGDDIFTLKTTYHDNKFLDDAYRATLEKLKEVDYNYYRIYCLGEWGSLGDLVYTNWTKENLTDKMASFDNIYNGLDFGFSSDPTSFISVHLDNKSKTIYIFNEFGRQEMFIDDIASEIKELSYVRKVTADSSEPRSIADLKRQGVNVVGAKKGPDSILHGINWIKGYKIVIHEYCINTIKELSTYSWKKDKEGKATDKPIDANNHWLDALRYALESEMKGAKKMKFGTKNSLGI